MFTRAEASFIDYVFPLDDPGLRVVIRDHNDHERHTAILQRRVRGEWVDVAARAASSYLLAKDVAYTLTRMHLSESLAKSRG